LTSESSKIESEKTDTILGSVAKFVGKFAILALNWIWRKSGTVCRYYWDRRDKFWRHFTEYARDLRPQRFVTREIRLSSEEEYLNAEFDGQTWKVRMPKMCITCGTPVDDKPELGIYQVENLTTPFWSVILGLFLGFILWFSTDYSWYMLLIGLAVGLMVGFGRHSVVEVKIRQWKCSKHKDSTRFPTLRTFADFLIIGVGSKELRQQFRLNRFGDRGSRASAGPAEERNEVTYEPVVPGRPESAEIDPIPLADEAHGSIEPEERDVLDPRTHHNSDRSR